MNHTLDEIPASPPYGPLDIQNTFGAILIGSFASIGLLGIATLQAWLYYRAYPDDRLFMKLLVGIIWSVELARSTVLAQVSYHFLILNWGITEVLNRNYWSLDGISLMTHIGEVLVHLYFAWRIHVLSRAMFVQRWVLTCVITILSLSSFGLGIASYILVHDSDSWAGYSQGQQQILTPATSAISIATDVAIMLSLVFLLNRGRTGIPRTEHLLDMLIFYTIQAGALTVVADATIIILNQLIDHVGFSFLGVYAIVGNMYTNSFLASLNARASLQAGLKPSSTHGITISPNARLGYAQQHIVPLVGFGVRDGPQAASSVGLSNVDIENLSPKPQARANAV